MRFIIRADRDITVAFEPTAAEYALAPGRQIVVEWPEGGDDGMVSMEADDFVVTAPTGGYTRAWDAEGVEIYVGPESGPDAR
ncbi:hypothetical protein [Streptomyces sp. TLI_146]|uniref:hypothetical protein n=1 Tax=Streptomyces sp. TLI_146 TaxID=1938858 RepID=UPI000C70947A|nr:hypothetical protein [Streptomyces sp. TLI_146]PKV83323.1 hypothetical protein BX283_0823 [Streptomyces sp. TLI_146]